ncbi:MAG: universal stress protein [Planctomycetota bacterium]
MSERKVLIPVDPAELSAQVIPPVVRRVLLEDGAHGELLCVLAGRDAYGLDERTAALRRRLDEVLRELGPELQGKVSTWVTSGDPTAEILARARDLDPWLLAMASHSRPAPVRWLRGSTTERVLRRATHPLLVHGPHCEAAPPPRLTRVLVALDGSERAEQVLPRAGELARAHGAELVLLRVGEERPRDALPDAPQPASEAELRRSLEPARARLKAAGLQVRARLGWGEPAEGILEAVTQEQADLLALTTHGYTGLDRWLFGSVAEKLLRAAPVPVLVLRTAATSLT